MSNTNFTDLGLNPALLKALATEGYTTPTPIQAQAIPSVLAGKDLLGIAQTGTGKTAAFALPILHRLAANPKPALHRGTRCLVLSPTRELASQIADSFRTYGRHLGLKVATVFGGVGMRPQINALTHGVDIVVATPGRLMDHMGERTITLEGTEILVLDEADQMMDLGFIRPLRQIVAKLPNRRQSLFFSATMPNEIGALAAELLRDPVKVSVTPAAKTADRVTQKVILIEQTKKRVLLAELFADPAMSRALVFTRTKRGADRVAKYLESSGVKVAAIHGNKSQGQREQALAAFKASKIRALIATDIAARGIDIDSVTHVVNYEIPNVPESYVHRIGRTARAGAEGIAISLVDGEERGYLRDIERLTKQTIPSEDRRGDATLVAPVEHGRSEDSDRPRVGDRRNGRPQNRNANGNRGERSGGFSGEGRRGAPHHRQGDTRNTAHTPRGDHGSATARPAAHRDHGDAPKAHWDPIGNQKPFEAPRHEHQAERRPDHRSGPRSDSRPDQRPERRNETRSERRPNAPAFAEGKGRNDRQGAGPGLGNVRFLNGNPREDRPGKGKAHAHRNSPRSDDRQKSRAPHRAEPGQHSGAANGKAPVRQRSH